MIPRPLPQPTGPRAAVVAFLAVLLALPASLLPAAASNDPLWPQQWSMAKIQAEQAWASSRGAGVKVAVVDTGVDFRHEDLAGKAAGSFTCIKDSDEVHDPCDPAPDGDDNGHGTHVAGIIAGNEGNGVGIASVAPASSIMSLKALNADGSGDLSSVLRAIYFAADNGARIINLSLGPEVNLINDLLTLLLGGDPQAEFQRAFDYAASKDAIVVAAAGNNGAVSFFSQLQNVYVIGSTGPDDQVAFYSSSGAEIFAPGGDSRGPCAPARCIITTSPGGYKAVQGTSFAAPHVSGLAALLLAQGVPRPAVTGRINETADPVPGGRRINALRAVTPGGAKPSGPVSPPLPPKPAPSPASPTVPLVPEPIASPISELLPILELSSTSTNPDREATTLSARKPAGERRSSALAVIAAALAALVALGTAIVLLSRRASI